MTNNPFQRYKELLKTYIDPQIIFILMKNWSSQDRYWHTFDHLSDVIRYIEKWKYRFSLAEFEQLILAAFFHDAIYDTRNPENNEEESLKLFRKGFTGDQKFEMVDKFILATKERKKPRAFLTKIFWEADNQVFKKGWLDYLKWENEIRKEYSWVDDNTYKKHRIKFLESNICTFGPKADTYIKKLIKNIKDK